MSKMIADRWAVLSLGYFSRNRYWGEDEGKSHRDALCTSTFIEIGGLRVVVDPPVAGKGMASILDQRTGLTPEQIDYVFITHCHADHYFGLGEFPNAKLLAAPGDCAGIQKDLRDPENQWIKPHIADGSALADRLSPAGEELVPGVTLLPLPGHTMGLTGLCFQAKEGAVVVAGDSVMTAEHFRDRRGYYNSVDFEVSRTTIETIASLADIVVPGHSNYFLARSV
jgi:glyoxylase-like metal-dependent hydrolase (beta-lactamase superfamily II)